MADSKITALPENTDPLVTDLLYLIDDPGGTPASNKLAISNLLKFLSGLTEDATPTDDAVIGYLNDISGTPTVNKITVPDLRGRQEVLLHDETLASAGSFDVSSIDQGYDDLLLLLSLRGDKVATEDVAYIFFNNDTTVANYHQNTMSSVNGVASSGEDASPFIGFLAAASAPSGSFGDIIIRIPLYTTTDRLKIVQFQASNLSAAGKIRNNLGHVVWEDGGNTAINRIAVQTDNDPTDEFVTGSRLRIIGIKYAS